MKVNKDKCHLFINSNENNLKKLLGETVFLKKVGLKVNALSGIFPYINFEKRRILMKSFL